MAAWVLIDVRKVGKMFRDSKHVVAVIGISNASCEPCCALLSFLQLWPTYSAKASAGFISPALQRFAVGQYVTQFQRIHDIDFVYHPPPRRVVPHAAALQSLHTRSAQGTACTVFTWSPCLYNILRLDHKILQAISRHETMTFSVLD